MFFNGTLDMFQRAYFARDNKDAKRECVCVPSACHKFFLQKNVWNVLSLRTLRKKMIILFKLMTSEWFSGEVNKWLMFVVFSFSVCVLNSSAGFENWVSLGTKLMLFVNFNLHDDIRLYFCNFNLYTNVYNLIKE